MPESIVSVNGKQFVAATKELKVKWNFTTPHAPWKGGVYERLVGLMKTSMRNAIGNRLLMRTEFIDLIIQVEES